MTTPQGPKDVPLFTFGPGNPADPPYLGAVKPIYKPGDSQDALPQETPFFTSRQFQLWSDEDLQGYNKLIDVLVKWRDRGWCEFSETSEWVPSKENWISWIKYYVLLRIPAEEMHLYLYDLDTMNIPVPAGQAGKEQA